MEKVFGLNGFIMYTIQNDCCVKLLEVYQIIQENTETITRLTAKAEISCKRYKCSEVFLNTLDS